MTWTCPYCQQNATILDHNQSISDHSFYADTVDGFLRLRTSIIVCPNSKCKQYVIKAFQVKLEPDKVNYVREIDGFIQRWELRPLSAAKPFPNFIPEPILKDYNEACLVKNLSPKASATLSRRCLQGVIRDYWGVTKNRLIDEINAIQDKVDPSTWSAIDAVRKVGNVGAHMEKDINVIVDVEPNEAQLLITLIEILFKDWYIARNEREKQLEAIVAIAARIDESKK
jgi:hypothetical protein